MKRITISLDDELYAMAKGHAAASQLSVSKAINDLLRRVVDPMGREAMPGDALTFTSAVTGLRVSRGERAVSLEDVRAALDDDDATIEPAGRQVSARS